MEVWKGGSCRPRRMRYNTRRGRLEGVGVALTLHGELVEVDGVGEWDLVGRGELLPDLAALLDVWRRQLEDTRQPPVHRLLEVLRPVRGEEDDALEALNLGQQLRHLGGAAGATRGKERLALIEEDDCVAQLRLAQDGLRRDAALGAQQGEVDKEDLLSEHLGHPVGRHGLPAAARPAEQHDQPLRRRNGLLEPRLARIGAQGRMRGEQGQQALAHGLREHDALQVDRGGVEVGRFAGDLLALLVEADEAVEHAAVERDTQIGQVVGAAGVRLGGDAHEALLHERAASVKVGPLLDLLVEGRRQHLQHAADGELVRIKGSAGRGLSEELLDDGRDGGATREQQRALLEGVQLELLAQALEPRRRQLARPLQPQLDASLDETHLGLQLGSVDALAWPRLPRPRLLLHLGVLDVLLGELRRQLDALHERRELVIQVLRAKRGQKGRKGPKGAKGAKRGERSQKGEVNR